LLLIVDNSFEYLGQSEKERNANLLGSFNYQGKLYFSNTKKYIYMIGIICYFKEFKIEKFLRSKYANIREGKHIRYLSCVDPTLYSNRLLEFAKHKIFC